MPDPTGRISHRDEFHRGISWKTYCRVATTADITIATALNAGDSIDGVTLAAGDRVLVKNQATGSQNGIYIAGATPIRAWDMDQDLTSSVPAEEVLGAVIHVIAGTANGGKLFRCTNTTSPVIGTTSLVFAEISTGGASLTIEEVDGAPSVAATELIFPNGTLGVVGTVATYTPATPGSTVDIEDEGAAEGAADTIDFTGAGVSVSFAAGTATVNIPGGGGGSTDDSGTLVQSLAWVNITADPQTKTLSSLPTNGNILLAFIVTNVNTVTSLTTTNVTWTLEARTHNTNGNQGVTDIWMGVVGASADDDIVIDLSGHNAEAIIVQEWSGLSVVDMKESIIVQSSSTAVPRLYAHTWHWDNPGGRLFVLTQNSTGGSPAVPDGLTASTGSPFNYGGTGYGSLLQKDAEADSSSSLGTRFIPPNTDNYTVVAIHMKP